RHHRRALDDRQEVALDPLVRHTRPVVAAPADDLIDLVEEDDATVLDATDRLVQHAVPVDQPVGLLVGQDAAGVGDRDAARATLGTTELRPVSPAPIRLYLLHGIQVREVVGVGWGDLDLDLDHLSFQLLRLQLRQDALALLAARLR